MDSIMAQMILKKLYQKWTFFWKKKTIDVNYQASRLNNLMIQYGLKDYSSCLDVEIWYHNPIPKTTFRLSIVKSGGGHILRSGEQINLETAFDLIEQEIINYLQIDPPLYQVKV